MTHSIRLLVVLLAGITLSISNMSAEARGGGRGGGGRGGFAGGGGSVQRGPSNYGSLRSSSPSGGGFNQPGFDANNYRGQSSSFDTQRGGQGTVGVTPGGSVAVRGETAGGYNYGGVQGPAGNRVVASQTPSGDVAVRHRDAGDGVINDLPNGYDTVYYDGNPYYYYDHQYYWPYYYGGEVYYQEVYAPPGATTTNLPDTYATAEIDGKTYYLYDGVYYVKQGENYVVVPSPVGAAAATNAPPPAPSNTPDPRSFLKAMSDYMGTCTSFQIQTTETTETPQIDGSTTESEVKRNILVQQPDHLTAAARIGSAVNRFWYDGETATIYQQAKGVYSNVKAPGGNAVMLNMLHDIYGMTIPLTDIIMPGLLESLEPRIQSLRYNGTGTAAGVLCNKIVIVTGDFQAQLWIEVSEKTPRPRMVEVIYTSQQGQPQYEATIDSWEDQPEIKDGIFTFTPPPNATKIQMVPVGSGG